jgi:hypothetical protein
MLVLFNLIPAFPMDGGRVLRAVLSHFAGLRRGTEIAARIGLFMAGALVALIFVPHNPMTGNPMMILVAAFVVFAGQQELFVVRQRELAQRAAPPRSELPAPDPLAAARGAMGAMQPHRLGFTGVTWDARHRVWIRWRDGQAVAAYSGRTE